MIPVESTVQSMSMLCLHSKQDSECCGNDYFTLTFQTGLGMLWQ